MADLVDVICGDCGAPLQGMARPGGELFQIARHNRPEGGDCGGQRHGRHQPATTGPETAPPPELAKPTAFTFTGYDRRGRHWAGRIDGDPLPFVLEHYEAGWRELTVLRELDNQIAGAIEQGLHGRVWWAMPADLLAEPELLSPEAEAAIRRALGPR